MMCSELRRCHGNMFSRVAENVYIIAERLTGEVQAEVCKGMYEFGCFKSDMQLCRWFHGYR